MSTITALTTVDSVKSTAPDTVNGLSDDVLNQLIKDAHVAVMGAFPKQVVVDGDDMTDLILEQAERYLTLHMASMDSSANRGVQSEQVDVLKTSYFTPNYSGDWFHTSIWGSRYWQLWLEYGRGGRFTFAVVQH